MGPIRTKLQQETRAAHEALHTHPLLARLLAADVTQAEYAGCLRVQYGFFSAIEAARGESRPDLGASGAVEALSADLRDVDAQADVGALGLPRSPSALLGALYVAHGSQFGGQVIGAALARSLPSLQHRFFSRGTDAALWRRLLSALEALGPSAEHITPAVSGAAAAFDLVARLADREAEALTPVSA
ncbi:MAG: biliverdin-producing heme oxygenase [Pseudomonadota bacterium]